MYHVTDDSNDATIVAVLQSICERNNGEITPSQVVAEAALLPEDHPLHQWFEWDDGLAASAHRVQQARMVLNKHRRHILVTSSSRVLTTLAAPYFVRHPEAGPAEQRYVSVSRLAMPDATELARSAVVAAYQRAAAALSAARNLARILHLEELVAEDIAHLTERQAAFAETRPEA